MTSSFKDIKIYNSNIDLQNNSIINANNIYTKSDVDNKIDKISSDIGNNIYTKAEIDNKFEDLPTGGFDESGEMNITLLKGSTNCPLVNYNDGYTSTDYVIYSNYYRKLGDMVFIRLIIGNPSNNIFTKSNTYTIQGLPFPIVGNSAMEIVSTQNDFTEQDRFNVTNYSALQNYNLAGTDYNSPTNLFFRVTNNFSEIHLKGWYRTNLN